MYKASVLIGSVPLAESYSSEDLPRAALANLWHACPKWHTRRFCVALSVLLR